MSRIRPSDLLALVPAAAVVVFVIPICQWSPGRD